MTVQFILFYPKNTYIHIFKVLIRKKRLKTHSKDYSKSQQNTKGSTLLQIVNTSVKNPSEKIMDIQAKNIKKLQRELVDSYIKPAGVADERILQAFMDVPRHLFVPPGYKNDAYLDMPLPISEGQTISQPSLVAVMTQALELKGKEKVLEIGTGSGFQAAILSRLSKKVYTVEIIESLAKKAKKNLEKLAIKNVHVEIADGSLGLPKFAPFDAIIVTAAALEIPEELINQLKENGRIVIPQGKSLANQQLKVGKKKGGKVQFTDIEPVMFVPLVGEYQKGKEVPKPATGHPKNNWKQNLAVR